jgi:nucleoside-diphosphate-sugar epimerase
MTKNSQCPSPRPFILTGASGWFGRAALHEYESLFGPTALRQDVIALASCKREIDFGSPYGPIQAYSFERLCEIEEPAGLLHLAFLTRDRIAEHGLEKYILLNRSITRQIALLLSVHSSIPVITTSSGAAAALDNTSPDLNGNPYATLKQEEESTWRSHALSRMAVVFRVYAATGRFMPSPQRFALGDFLLQAISRKPIRISSLRSVERSYVSAATLMQLSWRMLRRPMKNGFYSIDACTHELSLLSLAAQISELYDLPQPIHQIDTRLDADTYVGSPSAFVKALQDYEVEIPSLVSQIQETRAWLEASTSN